MADANTTHPWVVEGAGKLRFGVQTSLASDWPVTRDFSQAAEALGFDSIWIADHPLIGCDAWTTLAAIAGATQRIRLGSLVSCASYKNPVVLARQVADVDRISGGRAILGLGSGDLPWEFKQQGLEWGTHAERHTALTDTLEIVPQLLRGEAVEYSGDRFRVGGAVLSLPAVQQPRVPIVIAGGGVQTTLRSVAAHADACNLGAASWAGGAFTAELVREKFEVLQGYCQEAGRPFESLLRTTSVALFLGESETDVQARRRAIEMDPKRTWLLSFLGKAALFGTPAQAVQHFRSLARAGFQYIMVIASPLDTEALEVIASRIIPEIDGS
jgi:alkanesulfonate monooxygenase SsuD/methylene tetrahydromethanopterin reductase-like flavin-dependent oxidoreductase (luciferase family)